MEQIRIHPKTCDAKQLFGWLAEDGYHTWHDGIITRFLREKTKSKDSNWLILDGPLDFKWAENMESMMTTGVLSLYSGEELKISPTSKILFETTDLTNVRSVVFFQS